MATSPSIAHNKNAYTCLVNPAIPALQSPQNSLDTNPK